MPTSSYDHHRTRTREYQAEQSRRGRDIGVIPSVQDAELVSRMGGDLLLFLETCLPDTFSLPWSANHLAMAKYFQETIWRRGKCAVVAPRSEGKTSFSEGVSLWALLYGYSHFLILVGATKEAALDSYNSIKTELETNERLLSYFPSAVYPIQCLEGHGNRSTGQLYGGERTHIEWRRERLVFPTIAGSPSSGAIFTACGYDGRLRGRKHKTADGRNIRPDCLIFDDVQKDKTGKNPANADYLEQLLNRTVKFMGTRNRRLTVIVPGTCLNATCLMSRLMDRKRNPSWQGFLLKAINRMPDNMELWKEYYSRWTAENERLLEQGHGESAWDRAKKVADEYYVANRSAMDAGAVISWPDNIGEGDISALQTLMNQYLEDEAAFLTEFQNEPQQESSEEKRLTREIFLSKIRPLPRGVVPREANRLTVGLDLHKNVLYWIVCAWWDGFTGHVVDYGTYPRQPYADFTVENAPVTLETLYPGVSFEGRLYQSLETLCSELYRRDWRREDGVVLRLSQGLVDANWSRTTDTVQTFIQRHAEFRLLPARGRTPSRHSGQFYPSERKMSARTNFSYTSRLAPGDITQTVWVNTNKAKSFTLGRLVAVEGERGCLTLFSGRAEDHALFFNHLTSQYYRRLKTRDAELEEWDLLPGRKEDHWWDCLCLTVVGNAMEGGTLDEVAPVRKRSRKVFQSTRIQ